MRRRRSEKSDGRAQSTPEKQAPPKEGAETALGTHVHGTVAHVSARPHSVAVTGASSFLGRNLIGLLEEDERVERITSLDIERPTTAGQKTRVYDVDLTQPTAEERTAEILAAERVDTLVHLAFLASPTHATAWAHELESVGTMHILNACRRTEVRKLVLWSQTLLYGAHPTNPNFLSERHPVRARRHDPFFTDKIEAENDVLRFGRPGQGRIATVLRTAPILGPTVLGFDPLLQFVHEADAVAAFKLAIDRDAPGIFNIVADGVLPLSTVVKLAGRIALPLPRPFANTLVSALWMAHLSEAPPAFLDYLQYLCVADGEQAHQQMGFAAVYTTREAIIDFASAQHLRDVKLLSETPA